jgi:hypothetical protein
MKAKLLLSEKATSHTSFYKDLKTYMLEVRGTKGNEKSSNS